MGKFAHLADTMGRRFAPGEVIFRQGDAGDAMYLIYSGSVEVSRDTRGQRVVLDILGPGEIFGEMALVDSKARSATITATGEVTVIPVTSGFLRQNIKRDTRFIFQIIETLIIRIEKTARILRTGSGGSGSPFREEVPPGPGEADPDMLAFLRIFRGYADPEKYFHFTGGETIFHEGDMGDLMFIILDGTVDISADVQGHRMVMARLERGDFFGESALITDMPRSASAAAAPEAVVLPLVRKDLMEGITGDPDAALQLVHILIMRLRRNLNALTAGSTGV